MIAFLFSVWIDHFIQALWSLGGISPSNPHLLIFDSHSSHLTIVVVHKMWEVAYASIALQPLYAALGCKCH
jgi:hypothetical protein